MSPLEHDLFCTDGMKMNGRSVPPTEQSLRKVANFFALHYGGFHAGYLFFLVAMSTTADADVAMHKAEHAWLRASGDGIAGPAEVPGPRSQALRSRAGTIRS